MGHFARECPEFTGLRRDPPRGEIETARIAINGSTVLKHQVTIEMSARGEKVAVGRMLLMAPVSAIDATSESELTAASRRT